MLVYIKIFGDFGITKETKLQIENNDFKRSKTNVEKFNKLRVYKL
jgi:hypothetical protein